MLIAVARRCKRRLLWIVSYQLCFRIHLICGEERDHPAQGSSMPGPHGRCLKGLFPVTLGRLQALGIKICNRN